MQSYEYCIWEKARRIRDIECPGSIIVKHMFLARMVVSAALYRTFWRCRVMSTASGKKALRTGDIRPVMLKLLSIHLAMKSLPSY